MPEKIAVRARQAMEEQVFPGCVVGVFKKNGERHVLPFGNFTYEADSPRVREDTIYDLASITKSLPVASLALTLIAEEKLRPAEKVRTYLQDLRNDHGATIGDLLRYLVRGPRLSTLGNKTPEEITRFVLETGFDGPPGPAFYSNVPALLVGLIVERITGKTIEALAQEKFFSLLAMNDTGFFPTDLSRIPPSEVVGGAEIRGVVHDESARVFSRARKCAGHAGLFSTARDILNFLQALLQGKLPAVLDGARRGWGWQRAESWFMGEHFGTGAFGKTGFTGTCIGVDPEHDRALVILSNRTYPKRPADAASTHSAINVFRADIANIVSVAS